MCICVLVYSVCVFSAVNGISADRYIHGPMCMCICDFVCFLADVNRICADLHIHVSIVYVYVHVYLCARVSCIHFCWCNPNISLSLYA